MKKNTVLKVISIVLTCLTIVSIAYALTVKGGGFLDLSNIARVFYISIAAVCGIFAAVAWKYSKPKN